MINTQECNSFPSMRSQLLRLRVDCIGLVSWKWNQFATYHKDQSHFIFIICLECSPPFCFNPKSTCILTYINFITPHYFLNCYTDFLASKKKNTLFHSLSSLADKEATNMKLLILVQVNMQLINAPLIDSNALFIFSKNFIFHYLNRDSNNIT